MSYEPFKSEEELGYFRELFTNELTKNGLTSVSFGGPYVTAQGDTDKKYGTWNCAQMCATSDRNDWPAIVEAQVRSLLNSDKESAEFNVYEKSFAEVGSLLRVQLYPADFLDGIPFKDETFYKTDIPGTLTVLMIDLPSSIATVKKSGAKSWGKSDKELFEIGLRNTLAMTVVQQETHAMGDFNIVSLNGNDLLSAVHAFDFQKFDGVTGAHGTLIGIPTRHFVLCYPINDLGVVKAAQGMAVIISGMNNEGPGSLSPFLYWYKDGVFENEPYTIENKNFNFIPKERFVTELNKLKAQGS